MNQQQRLNYLLQYFLTESPQGKHIPLPKNTHDQKNLLRSLMNIRPPLPIKNQILEVQNTYLQEELHDKIVSLSSLTPIKPNLYLWQGDITTLGVDAIVNAANSDMLGCFQPCHSCIDNIIHTYAGVQLRIACHEIMFLQGKQETTGNAKITSAYNLPSNYVIHTVGPIVRTTLDTHHKEGLQKCYESCLHLALDKKLHSIAFCCISTGEFHFPQDVACDIATETVATFLKKHPNQLDVIFNVFKDEDLKLYEAKLT